MNVDSKRNKVYLKPLIQMRCIEPDTLRNHILPYIGLLPQVSKDFSKLCKQIKFFQTLLLKSAAQSVLAIWLVLEAHRKILNTHLLFFFFGSFVGSATSVSAAPHKAHFCELSFAQTNLVLCDEGLRWVGSKMHTWFSKSLGLSTSWHSYIKELLVTTVELMNVKCCSIPSTWFATVRSFSSCSLQFFLQVLAAFSLCVFWSSVGNGATASSISEPGTTTGVGADFCFRVFTILFSSWRGKERCKGKKASGKNFHARQEPEAVASWQGSNSGDARSGWIAPIDECMHCPASEVNSFC